MDEPDTFPMEVEKWHLHPGRATHHCLCGFWSSLLRKTQQKVLIKRSWRDCPSLPVGVGVVVDVVDVSTVVVDELSDEGKRRDVVSLIRIAGITDLGEPLGTQAGNGLTRSGRACHCMAVCQ